VSTPSQVALVTGANRGIGLEVTRQLASLGYTVVLCARDLRKAEGAAAQIREDSFDVRPQQLDVDEDATVARACTAVSEELGRLDVLVNNAAIGFDPDDRAVETDLAAARVTLDTNVFGAWRVTQAFLPLLRRSERGRIVNVTSRGGSFGWTPGLRLPGIAAYSVSKAALNALTVKLASELADTGILVNAVCPGATATSPGAFGRPVADGASGIVWAATLPEGGPTGQLFGDREQLSW